MPVNNVRRGRILSARAPEPYWRFVSEWVSDAWNTIFFAIFCFCHRIPSWLVLLFDEWNLVLGIWNEHGDEAYGLEEDFNRTRLIDGVFVCFGEFLKCNSFNSIGIFRRPRKKIRGRIKPRAHASANTWTKFRLTNAIHFGWIWDDLCASLIVQPQFCLSVIRPLVIHRRKCFFFRQKMTGYNTQRAMESRRRTLYSWSWLINWNLYEITTRKMYSQRLTEVNAAFTTAQRTP